MNYASKRICPICSSSKFEEIYANNFCKLETLDLSYCVCSCLACGFIYANYIPDSDTYQNYYTNFSKYDVYDSEDKIPQIDQEIADLSIDFIKSNNVSFESAYDIGCSIGLFLSKLKSNFNLNKVTGIDPSPNSKIISKKLFDLDIDTGFYDGKDTLEEYGLIISSCVLEHIVNVNSFINNISINTKEGTFLVLVVPSLNDFPDTKGEWLGELSLEHINFFNEFSLNNILSNNNFMKISFVRKKLYNGQFALIYLAQKKSIRKGDKINFDETGKYKMQKYISNNNLIRKKIVRVLKKIKKPYTIFGAGSHTLRLLALPDLKDNYPIYILDSNINLQNKKVSYLSILPPNSNNLITDSTVVISSFRGISSIEKVIKEYSFNGQIVKLY